MGDKLAKSPLGVGGYRYRNKEMKGIKRLIKGRNIHAFSGNGQRLSRSSGITSFQSFYGSFPSSLAIVNCCGSGGVSFSMQIRLK
jgi:hypothetical protein